MPFSYRFFVWKIYSHDIFFLKKRTWCNVFQLIIMFNLALHVHHLLSRFCLRKNLLNGKLSHTCVKICGFQNNEILCFFECKCCVCNTKLHKWHTWKTLHCLFFFSSFFSRGKNYENSYFCVCTPNNFFRIFLKRKEHVRCNIFNIIISCSASTYYRMRTTYFLVFFKKKNHVKSTNFRVHSIFYPPPLFFF